jgi:transposase, IS30 family
MRSGLTNTAACTILGVTRRTGGRIRARYRQQTAPPSRPVTPSGRYLSLRERLQIADLLRLNYPMRRIAVELGRSPSTIKRELDRHRDEQGRYLPQSADHTARVQRRRPRQHKLIASPALRTLVQRKLNRCWSPDEISGWLRRTYPHDTSMWLCPETIYRALLVPGGKGLHKRYCRRLRTGRRIRKSRWLTRSGHGATVQNKTMIDKRPAEVETREQAGHWEGDLILGARCASAMMTLRERKTQYGIVINLPVDHTAETVNAAAIQVFAPLPPHMKRTLTWDQGVEMAQHHDLATATGVDIYFAERCSPWQRGANENYNGLLRQYFPKGTDLSVHTDVHVATVMRELNTRPRKTLGYDTPASRFRIEIRNPPGASTEAVGALAG